MSFGRIAAFSLATIASALPALSDDNVSTIIQDGSTHSGSIVQTGDRNIAGNDANDIEQLGVDDDLTLTQSGDDNVVGLTGSGLTQIGTASANSAPANTTTILQNSNGNRIGELTQVTFGTHATTGNALNITQDLGDDNTILVIYQSVADGASSNAATITQTGHDNWFERLNQQATSSDGDNSVTLTMTGSFNGINGSLSGVGDLKVFGLSAGATPGEILQGSDSSGGAHNRVTLIITGDYNQFGVSQYGVDNTIGARTITGLGNSFGAFQMGTGNQINGGAIVGDGNDLGIRQVGDANLADVNMLSDSSNNQVGIGQGGQGNDALVALTGNDNVTGVSQLGTAHVATVTIAGDSNLVLGIQINDGLTASHGNDMTVSINGNGNNGLLSGSPQAFTGPALLVASASPGLSASQIVAPDASFGLVPSATLLPGMLVQWGEDNFMDIAVGDLTASHGNLFAAVQKGLRNSLMASVNGNYNQLAVLQVGDDDVASVVQSGNYNVAGISQ